MKVYCDTDSLLSNPQRRTGDAKSKQEAAAIQKLLEHHQAGKITLLRSNVLRGEVERTQDQTQRDKLRRDFLDLVPVALDEKFLGADSQCTDPFGGHVINPFVSDVQDEDLSQELQASGLKRLDAQHLAQAISNGVDVLLTRDGNFIKRRAEFEAKYKIKILRPSELLAQVP
jgi:hypothetical protein